GTAIWRRSAARPVRLSAAVSESWSPPRLVQPCFRSRDHLMSVISDAENYVMCDCNSSFAFGWVTPATVSSPIVLLPFVESPALVLIQQRYLAAVHGALIQLNGCGVLLCGTTCAGKSTLSYACARSGWTLVSDDGTFLIRDREDRYGIGNPYRLRFRQDAKSLFPELENWPAEL